MSNPVEPQQIGANRTGTATSPIESKRTIEGAREGSPAPDPELLSIDAVRLDYSRAVPPVGTMPPPASLKGAVKAAATALKGEHPMVFLDLVAERLAFERTGTRLYDALLVKYDASHAHAGGPERDDIERIRDDELRHFALLKDAIESLGGDPTAMTPSADVTAVASMGLVQVLTDPRTTLTEALKAILIAELADNDAWLVLTDMADRIGQHDLAIRFREALSEEENHLAHLRTWVTTMLDQQAGIEPKATLSADELGQPMPH
jgi:rubrerythrin